MTREKRKTFPMLPAVHWWSLRKKFRREIPSAVTDLYLSKLLKTKPESVKVNVLPYLKAIGFIDEQGLVQDRVQAWIEDDRYGDVCAGIIENLYPEDLRNAIADPRENRAALEAWFKEKTGAGSSAVKRMASFYTLLAEADPSKGRKGRAGKAGAPRKTKPPRPKPVKKEKAAKPGKASRVPSPELVPVNVNIQVHIPSNASKEQIQEIFRNMNKYFKGKLTTS